MDDISKPAQNVQEAISGHTGYLAAVKEQNGVMSSDVHLHSSTSTLKET